MSSGIHVHFGRVNCPKPVNPNDASGEQLMKIDGKAYYKEDIFECSEKISCCGERYFTDPFELNSKGYCEHCAHEIKGAEDYAAEVREQYYFGQTGK